MQKVKDVMETTIKTVSRATSFSDVLSLFKGFHCFPLVPVVDSNNTLEGIVSLQGIIEIFSPQHYEILKTLPLVNRIDQNIFDLEVEEGIGTLIIVDDIMERRFARVAEDASIERAYREMELNSRQILPVVDTNEKLVGIVGKFDIVMAVFKSKGVLS